MTFGSDDVEDNSFDLTRQYAAQAAPLSAAAAHAISLRVPSRPLKLSVMHCYPAVFPQLKPYFRAPVRPLCAINCNAAEKGELKQEGGKNSESRPKSP